MPLLFQNFCFGIWPSETLTPRVQHQKHLVPKKKLWFQTKNVVSKSEIMISNWKIWCKQWNYDFKSYICDCKTQNQTFCIHIRDYAFKIRNSDSTLWKSEILIPNFANQKFWFKIRNSDSKHWKSEILIQNQKLWCHTLKIILILNQKFRFQTLKIRNSDSKSEILILNRKFWLQKLKIRNSDSKSEILIPNFENQKFWFWIRNSDFFVQYVFTTFKCELKTSKLRLVNTSCPKKQGGIRNSDSKSEVLIPHFEYQKFWF